MGRPALARIKKLRRKKVVRVTGFHPPLYVDCRFTGKRVLLLRVLTGAQDSRLCLGHSEKAIYYWHSSQVQFPPKVIRQFAFRVKQMTTEDFW